MECSIVFIVLSAMVTNVAGGVDWSYEGTYSPDEWHLVYPHCGGVKQSPINIISTDVILNSSLLTPFVFTNYNTTKINSTFNITNNGHTVQVDVTDGFFEITGSGLADTYVTKQFHFHWGKNDTRGSEHLIDGKHFPMEMHIVHYNKKYDNFSNAVNQTLDGLAVLGFLFEIVPTMNDTKWGNNSAFQMLIDNFDNISYKGQNTSIDAFPIEQLIPTDLGMFYRYEGSLTTPPCYESVQWTVFKETIKITEDQLSMFRNRLYENSNETSEQVNISDDFRPVQCLASRKVYASDASLKTYTTVPPVFYVTKIVYVPSTGTRSSGLLLLVMLCMLL